MGGTVVVDELIATTVFGIAESPDQERRHLLACHRIIGAEATRIGLVAAFGDTCSDEQVDARLVGGAVVVPEEVAGAGIVVPHGSDQE